MAGTPAQARTRAYGISQIKSWGLETEVRSYKVWMPHPLSTRVWRITPDSIELNLEEGPIPEDTTSVAFPQVIAFNAYGAAGDVRGEVVYVNYGLIEDYAHLDSVGISVAGKVVIARYGRSFRGIKAREAERHDAAAAHRLDEPQAPRLDGRMHLLSAVVQGAAGFTIIQVLERDPHSGHLFAFRGRRGDLIKILWHDDQGMCLFVKRLERGRFIWPSPADGVVRLTPAQLAVLAIMHIDAP